MSLAVCILYRKYLKILIIGFTYYKINSNLSHCKESEKVKAGEIKEGLTYYTDEEVLKHNKESESIWVSFRNGVYDITEFIASHPGNKKILKKSILH